MGRSRYTGGDGIGAEELRAALRSYATGVTVVTTRTPENRPVGITVNSFASLSLEPPLVLWNLARRSPSVGAFRQAGWFAVNVLAVDQADLSRRFATPLVDKFQGVDRASGLAGLPLIAGCVASLECRIVQRYAGGDHVIFIGEVQRLNRRSDREPLIFLAGEYRRAAVADGS